MRSSLLYVYGIALFASCSAPKFASQPAQGNEAMYALTEEPAVPFALDESTLVASVSAEHIYLAGPIAEPVTTSKPATLTREEKKELRKEAIRHIKAYTKAVKDGDKVAAAELKQAMDNDLKFAAIFGAVGITALIIGGDVFYIIGGIALIIGVVFFVKWMIRQ